MTDDRRQVGRRLTVINGGKNSLSDPGGLEPWAANPVEPASDDPLPYPTARNHFLRLQRVGDARDRQLAVVMLSFLDRFGSSAWFYGWTELELFGASTPLQIENDGRVSCSSGDCGIAFLVGKSDCEFFVDKVIVRTGEICFSVNRSDLNRHGCWTYYWETFLDGA
jgi:hypothetical protein